MLFYNTEMVCFISVAYPYLMALLIDRLIDFSSFLLDSVIGVYCLFVYFIGFAVCLYLHLKEFLILMRDRRFVCESSAPDAHFCVYTDQPEHIERYVICNCV